MHATADGVLVAFHDSRAGPGHRPDGRDRRAPVRRGRPGPDRRPGPDPPLSELFEAFPDARFNIDAKSDGAVDLLAATIAEHDAYERVCVSSFGVRRLHRLRRLLGPRVASRRQRGGRRGQPVRALADLGAEQPRPGAADAGEHPFLGRRLQRAHPGLVQAVHRAGKQVHIWTVDDSETMERLIDAGVDGIFTDRIDILKDVLIHRGLWTEDRSGARPTGPGVSHDRTGPRRAVGAGVEPVGLGLGGVERGHHLASSSRRTWSAAWSATPSRTG